MLDITESLECSSIEKIEHEISERKELLTKMVGTLYPSIVRDEINTLNRLLWNKKYGEIEGLLNN